MTYPHRGSVLLSAVLEQKTLRTEQYGEVLHSEVFCLLSKVKDPILLIWGHSVSPSGGD